ncbi:MAG: YigZ family protein [Bacilli bacterium]|nr:YigZ family protein [Bacilli bacterium]
MDIRIPLATSNGYAERNKSRFEAELIPLSKTEDFPDVYAQFLKRHPKADHYPYAYCIAPLSKSSDDGEPGGSGGRPLLSLLSDLGVDQAVLIVARYFGGTKLGVGNLRRCFVEAGKSAIDAGRFGTPKTVYDYVFECDYAQYDALSKWAKAKGKKILSPIFGETVRATLRSDDKISLEGILPGDFVLPEPDPKTIIAED